MNKFYFLAIAFALFLFSCRSANKAYQKGNYYEAIDLSLRKLQKDPYDGEAKSVLVSSYKNVIAETEDNIRILNKSSNEFKYEQVFNEYSRLQSLYTKIKVYPTLASVAKGHDYSDQLTSYGQKAADVYYERGLILMARNTKQYYREAYYEFKKCLRFPSYKEDTNEKIDQAYNAALVNLVVLPMDNYGGYVQAVSYRMRNFEEQMVRSLRNNAGEFVRVYTQYEAEGKKINADQFLEMRSGRFDMGRAEDKTRSRTVSKEVVTKEIVYKPDSIVQVKSNVYANITTTDKKYTSSGELLLIMRNKEGKILWNDRATGEHICQTQVSSFTGDERALSDSDRDLIYKKQEALPSEDEISRQLLNNLENETRNKIRQYLNALY